MHRWLPALAALLPLSASAADIARTGLSSVTIHPRGAERDFRTATTRFLPYVIRDARTHAYHQRLVTVRTTIRESTDRDGITGRVAVLVEDLDRHPPRRLAQWSDDGLDGTLLATADPPVFVTATAGCCGVVPGLHVTRLVETGRPLFRSSGSGPVGTAAWFEAETARFDSRRWAALELDYGYTHPAEHSAALLRYGDRTGTLQTLEVRVGPEPNAAVVFAQRNWSEDSLLWDNGPGLAARSGLQRGAADVPAVVAIGRTLTSVNDLDGVSLVLRIPESLDGKTPAATIARIPIEAGRLQPAKAELAPGLTLVETP